MFGDAEFGGEFGGDDALPGLEEEEGGDETIGSHGAIVIFGPSVFGSSVFGLRVLGLRVLGHLAGAGRAQHGGGGGQDDEQQPGADGEGQVVAACQGLGGGPCGPSGPRPDARAPRPAGLPATVAT